MRLLNSYYSKSFLKLKQIFNLIKTMINVRIYSLQKIAFNYYKMNVINLFSVLITRKSYKCALTTRRIMLKNFQIKDQIMLFTKNLKNVRFKKKLFYKFTNFFKIIDVINAQKYCLKLLK